MNKTLPRALVAVLCVFCATVYAQTLSITRDQAAYHPERVLYPATLLSPDNFKDIESGQYVVVEGYIDYYAVTWPDADGDYHFEMQSTDKEHTHNPHSMVCAIGYFRDGEMISTLAPVEMINSGSWSCVSFKNAIRVRPPIFLWGGTDSSVGARVDPS